MNNRQVAGATKHHRAGPGARSQLLPLSLPGEYGLARASQKATQWSSQPRLLLPGPVLHLQQGEVPGSQRGSDQPTAPAVVSSLAHLEEETSPRGFWKSSTVREGQLPAFTSAFKPAPGVSNPTGPGSPLPSLLKSQLAHRWNRDRPCSSEQDQGVGRRSLGLYPQ